MRVVGVDGCPGGWVAAAYNTTWQQIAFRTYTTLAELIADRADAACIAVDIPIGLTQSDGRCCDIEARKVLGPRRSSVFPAPNLPLLDAVVDQMLDYVEASELSRSMSGKGISKQAFAIFAKIDEANRVITPALQKRIIEVHPEVSFWALAGQQPTEYRKGKLEGFEERRSHLAMALQRVHIPTRQEAGTVAPPAKADDVLDAIVGAWTARRFAEGCSRRLPPQPPTDMRGLRMEIVY
jgi:predicted RNase H-like nuclease